MLLSQLQIETYHRLRFNLVFDQPSGYQTNQIDVIMEKERKIGILNLFRRVTV